MNYEIPIGINANICEVQQFLNYQENYLSQAGRQASRQCVVSDFKFVCL